jgi:hypothetical protein
VRLSFLAAGGGADRRAAATAAWHSLIHSRKENVIMEVQDPGCLELLRFFFGIAVLALLLAILI